MYSNQNYGPWFGHGGNLGLQNNTWKSYFNPQYPTYIAYPKVGIPDNFNVDDYEVFQVIKK